VRPHVTKVPFVIIQLLCPPHTKGSLVEALLSTFSKTSFPQKFTGKNIAGKYALAGCVVSVGGLIR
jgi:hypothetical protein